MSNRKRKMYIGLSYVAPYYHMVGVYRLSAFEPVFFHQAKTLSINDYPRAIWVASLPYGLFHFSEHQGVVPNIEKTSQTIVKLQYLGLKNGVAHWQSCQIAQSIYLEHTAYLQKIQILELDLLALWDYTLAITQYPFHARLVLWRKSPYVIGLHGREGSLWQVYYWPESSFWQHVLQIFLSERLVISSFLALDAESDMTIEYLYKQGESDFTLALALAYRGFKHGL